MILYNLKSIPQGYAITKFDNDFMPTATYLLTEGGKRCDCPAGQRTIILKPCKHRKMLPYMLGALDTDRFYCYETGEWSRPLAAMADAYEGVAETISEPEPMQPASPEPAPQPLVIRRR